LILRKISKFGATRCDFKAKMHQILFPLGFRPRPGWGSLSAPPDPLLLRGGREGEKEKPKIREGVKGGEENCGDGWEGNEDSTTTEGEGKERGMDLPDQCQTASYAPARSYSTNV